MPPRSQQTSGSLTADDTIAVPLDSEQFAAVRVLRTAQDKEGMTALVAVTPWRGTTPPDVGERSLRSILRLNRGHFGGRPALCWYAGNPPSEFVYVGNIPPMD